MEAQNAAQVAIKDYFAGVQLMKAGKLVPDDVCIAMIEQRIQHDQILKLTMRYIRALPTAIQAPAQ